MVVDSTLDRIKAENTIEIFNYVAYLRTRRTAMVQTEVCHPPLCICARPGPILRFHTAEGRGKVYFALFYFICFAKKNNNKNKKEAKKKQSKTKQNNRMDLKGHSQRISLGISKAEKTKVA